MGLELALEGANPHALAPLPSLVLEGSSGSGGQCFSNFGYPRLLPRPGLDLWESGGNLRGGCRNLSFTASFSLHLQPHSYAQLQIETFGLDWYFPNSSLGEVTEGAPSLLAPPQTQ